MTMATNTITTFPDKKTSKWPEIPECIKWVHQEDVNGCAIACCAMIAGCSYSEAKAFFAQKQANAGERPVGTFEIHEFLNSRGWIRDGYAYHFQKKDETTPKDWPPQPFQDVNMCTVLCNPDPCQTHAVLMFRDGCVLDPLHNGVTSLSDYHAVFAVTGWKREEK